jgi:hypothetical protein
MVSPRCAFLDISLWVANKLGSRFQQKDEAIMTVMASGVRAEKLAMKKAFRIGQITESVYFNDEQNGVAIFRRS